MNNILILCIGNICRSPMAEALLQQWSISQNLETTVCSAGIHAVVASPANSVSQELMSKRGIDISKHRARQLSKEIIMDADLILTMDTKQQQYVESQFSGTKGRVYRIGKMGGFDVPDPYKRPQIIFEQSLALIEQGIREWQRILWG